MLYSKSITFVEEDLENAAVAAGQDSDYVTAEEAFIENLRAGDAQAFDVLITRYSPDIYALLCRLTQDADEAGDLTQETFLKALRSIGKFRGDSELKTWLFRIAINESRNRFRWWRRRRREKTVSLDAPVNDSELRIHDTVAGNERNPEETLLDDEYRRALHAAMGRLPDVFREALVLCDIEGQSYQEIAKMLEINIGTVKSRISRGRDELRKQLKDF
jgi:RNA polymerase sigma-70 factor (ECF subfamily)